MNALELVAARKKFRRIQKLNSQVFKLLHELSQEEWEVFRESWYVWPVSDSQELIKEKKP